MASAPPYCAVQASKTQPSSATCPPPTRMAPPSEPLRQCKNLQANSRTTPSFISIAPAPEPPPVRAAAAQSLPEPAVEQSKKIVLRTSSTPPSRLKHPPAETARWCWMLQPSNVTVVPPIIQRSGKPADVTLLIVVLMNRTGPLPPSPTPMPMPGSQYAP
eukprot:7025224-Prymnesium_polylepis.3